MKSPVAGRRPPLSAGKIQPVLLFLTGMGFLALGLRVYPAFIAVGVLFLVIGYRGLTCAQGDGQEVVAVKTDDDPARK